jgi:hypothetical protein
MMAFGALYRLENRPRQLLNMKIDGPQSRSAQGELINQLKKVVNFAHA